MTAAIESVPAAAGANEPSELSCVLMPLLEGQLLLPSVCVAEITPWQRIRAFDGAPDWCLGLLRWRGETVPVIRFERLNQAGGESLARGRCLVVMNRTGASGPAPFYALALDALPRLVQLADGDLSDHDAELGCAESRAVRFGTETASIPNLAYVEQQVAALPPAS
jgi:chemosensory pili system protein ChpC